MEEGIRPGLTQRLNAAANGDAGARDLVFREIYAELKDRATTRLRGQSPHDSLSATALVSELYLKCFRAGDRQWLDRNHFFLWAGRAMRSIVLDRVRTRRREKRSANGEQVALDALVAHIEETTGDVERIDRALEELEEVDSRLVEVIHQRFFLGRTVAETAETLGLGPRTVERVWTLARRILRDKLQ